MSSDQLFRAVTRVRVGRWALAAMSEYAITEIAYVSNVRPAAELFALGERATEHVAASHDP